MVGCHDEVVGWVTLEDIEEGVDDAETKVSGGGAEKGFFQYYNCWNVLDCRACGEGEREREREREGGDRDGERCDYMNCLVTKDKIINMVRLDFRQTVNMSDMSHLDSVE